MNTLPFTHWCQSDNLELRKVVKAPQNNVWERPVYTPPKIEPARSGANDALTLKSRGLST